jgi:hypothetical protein
LAADCIVFRWQGPDFGETVLAQCLSTIPPRGVSGPAAKRAADAGVALLKMAFDHWGFDETKRDLAHHLCCA